MQKELIQEVEKPSNEHFQNLTKVLAEGFTHKEDAWYKQSDHLGLLRRAFEEWMTISQTEVEREIGEEINDVLNKAFEDQLPFEYLEIRDYPLRYIVVNNSRFVWDQDKKKLTGDPEGIRRLEDNEIPF